MSDVRARSDAKEMDVKTEEIQVWVWLAGAGSIDIPSL